MSCENERAPLDTRPDASSSSSAAAGDVRNLYEYIDHGRVWGVNVEPPEDAKVPFKPWDERNSLLAYAESGVDDQLIITVPFTCAVRVRAILINRGRGDFAPTRCTVYVNRPHGVDFDEVAAATSGTAAENAVLGPPGSDRPQADFALLEGDAGTIEYPVSASRFAHTNSVSIMLERTRVFYIGFIGSALDLRRDPLHQFDVAAANTSTRPVDGVSDPQGAASTPSVR